MSLTPVFLKKIQTKHFHSKHSSDRQKMGNSEQVKKKRKSVKTVKVKLGQSYLVRQVCSSQLRSEDNCMPQLPTGEGLASANN